MHTMPPPPPQEIKAIVPAIKQFRRSSSCSIDRTCSFYFPLTTVPIHFSSYCYCDCLQALPADTNRSRYTCLTTETSSASQDKYILGCDAVYSERYESFRKTICCFHPQCGTAQLPYLHHGADSRNSPHFMGPEGSLPHSQQPATCPYPEPARSSPCPHIPLTEDPS